MHKYVKTTVVIAILCLKNNVLQSIVCVKFVVNTRLASQATCYSLIPSKYLVRIHVETKKKLATTNNYKNEGGGGGGGGDFRPPPYAPFYSTKPSRTEYIVPYHSISKKFAPKERERERGVGGGEGGCRGRAIATQVMSYWSHLAPEHLLVHVRWER